MDIHQHKRVIGGTSKGKSYYYIFEKTKTRKGKSYYFNIYYILIF